VLVAKDAARTQRGAQTDDALTPVTMLRFALDITHLRSASGQLAPNIVNVAQIVRIGFPVAVAIAQPNTEHIRMHRQRRVRQAKRRRLPDNVRMMPVRDQFAGHPQLVDTSAIPILF